MTVGGGASSYQVEFPTYAMCEFARKTLIADAARINAQSAKPPLVEVSAVCVDQKKQCKEYEFPFLSLALARFFHLPVCEGAARSKP